MARSIVLRPGHVPTEAYERFVRSVVDYAMFFLDPEGVICSWSPGAELIKGYSEKEIVGQHFSVFYPPADLEARKPQYELTVAREEGRFEDEGWRVRKDGTMFWANVVITAVHDGDGTLIGFAKITRDLTQRKQAEEMVRRSEERFRILVQSVRDYAIFMLDPSGRIVSWNEGAKRLKGYEADEIVGHHFRRFYLPDDVARRHPEAELATALEVGRYEEEGWRVRKDGTTFWASVTITAVFDDHGRHVGFAKVTRDLTERKRTEEQLRHRADSYASLNRELDAFSHAVAHDLRSPVRAVEHLSRVLLEEEAGRVSEEGRTTLRAMHSSAERMSRLVQDLLDLSIASGRDPVRAVVDITALAREVAGDLRKGGAPAAELRVAEGLTAKADPHLVRVALTNLLGNALKFAGRMDRPLVEVGAASTPDGPAFFVRDNGVGFDPAQAERLFQPFARLPSAGAFEGTGIGLATVRRIVERHGGKVWAVGGAGVGATFYFTLWPGG